MYLSIASSFAFPIAFFTSIHISLKCSSNKFDVSVQVMTLHYKPLWSMYCRERAQQYNLISLWFRAQRGQSLVKWPRNYLNVFIF